MQREWVIEEVARLEKIARSYEQRAAQNGASTVQRALLKIDAQFNRKIARGHRLALKLLARTAGE